MKCITCFNLYNISGDERGIATLQARFSTRGEAEEAKKADGYPEYLKQVREEVICVFESAIEWSPKLDKVSRATGLAKLTPEERAALGI